MNRRELMGLIACTIVGGPMAATAQQVDKPRRVACSWIWPRMILRGRLGLPPFDLNSVDWDGPVLEIR